MTLSERSVIDKIEVLENGKIQVRRADIVEKDGIEIARNYHRHLLHPGDDLSNEDPKVVAVATAVWTQEVVEAWQAFVAEQEANMP